MQLGAVLHSLTHWLVRAVGEARHKGLVARGEEDTVLCELGAERASLAPRDFREGRRVLPSQIELSL